MADHGHVAGAVAAPQAGLAVPRRVPMRPCSLAASVVVAVSHGGGSAKLPAIPACGVG